MITNTCLVHEEHLLVEGRFEFVEFLILFFLSGETPLFLSAYFGRAEVARYLLAHGADPKLGGNTGSPLHAAAVKGLSLFPSPTST
jgi:ankyrin repeat protein